VQHPCVEFEPAQLAIDEQRRREDGVSHVRTVNDTRRGSLLGATGKNMTSRPSPCHASVTVTGPFARGNVSELRQIPLARGRRDPKETVTGPLALPLGNGG
jgi:hypothetical protein